MKPFIALLLICLTLVSCKKEEVVEKPTIYPTSGNYKYGEHTLQEMDVQIPATFNEQTPLFIVVHGGGWAGGEKNELYGFYTLLRDSFPNAYVANINYRLCEPGVPIVGEQLQDLQLARSWFNLKFPNWKGKTYFLGYSAGAHLSLMYALTNYDGKIGGVVNLLGHSDLTIPEYINSNTTGNFLHNVVGIETYASNPQIWESNSPIFHVSAVTPPILSFYTGQDVFVPQSQGIRFHDKLNDFGITNFVHYYPNEGHFDWTSETTLSFHQNIVGFFRELE